MTLNPIIFFDLVITILILSITIVICFVYFLKEVKKFQAYRIEIENQKDGIAKKKFFLAGRSKK